MAKKRKALLTAALAFAATPQGQQLLKQAKEYAQRPETKLRAQQLVAQARTRAQGVKGAKRSAVSGPTSPTPTYGTPTQP
jgi:hypothetical protein